MMLSKHYHRQYAYKLKFKKWSFYESIYESPVRKQRNSTTHLRILYQYIIKCSNLSVVL